MIDNITEVNSLIRLLDDPDSEIFTHVHDKLISYGPEIVSYLESAFGEAFDPVLRERIANLVHEIQFTGVKNQLDLWYQGGAFDLLQGVLTINKYQYPDLDEQKIINQLEGIKRDIWLQLNNESSPSEQIKLVNHILYNMYGFNGNTTHHQDPQNSYLSQVLESKKGNQILLAIIYSIIAQKLNMPVYGVNLPQYFILAYVDESNAYQEFADNGVLFYINAFNKGHIFGKRDVDAFLKKLHLNADPQFYQPCSNADIIRRILRNLISSYEQLGSSEKVAELNELLEIVS